MWVLGSKTLLWCGQSGPGSVRWGCTAVGQPEASTGTVVFQAHLPLHLSMMQDVLPRTPLGDVNCNPLPGDPPIAGWHRLSPRASLGWWFSNISIGMLHDCCELSCLGACWTFDSRNTCLAALLQPFLLQKHEHILVWTKVLSNLCWQFPWLVFQAHPECHRAELPHLLFNCFFLILHRYEFVITANSYCKSLLHPLCMFYVFSFGHLCFCSAISFCCCMKAGSHGLTMLKAAIFDSLGCDMTLTSEPGLWVHQHSWLVLVSTLWGFECWERLLDLLREAGEWELSPCENHSLVWSRWVSVRLLVVIRGVTCEKCVLDLCNSLMPIIKMWNKALLGGNDCSVHN